MSWEAPESPGGAPVTGYRVQWKSPTQDYAEERAIEITLPEGDDGAWLEAQYRQAEITGLDAHVEHTAKVQATNDHYGYGQAAAAKSTPSGAGGLDEPVQNLTVAADDQAAESHIGLAVSWEPPAGDSADEITRYVVQWRLLDDDYDPDQRQAIVAATSATAYTLIIGSQAATKSSDTSITRHDSDIVTGENYEVRAMPASDSSQGPPPRPLRRRSKRLNCWGSSSKTRSSTCTAANGHGSPTYGTRWRTSRQ